MKVIPRTHEIAQLQEIIKSKKSEFVYIRGRRRVGKSWLLDELRATTSNCFFSREQRMQREKELKRTS